MLEAVTILTLCVFRDRPAAIPIEIKSIDDTSNFDEFPDVDLKWRKYSQYIPNDYCVRKVLTSCILLVLYLSQYKFILV